jgi:ketosteroid isomerase-like protein
MSTSTALSIDSLREAARAGGTSLAQLVTDDVEFVEVDQKTPPSSPAVHRGREALSAMADDLERRGIQMEVDDGFIVGDRGAIRAVCTYPDGRRVVEHAMLTLRDGKISRWSGVQAWDE